MNDLSFAKDPFLPCISFNFFQSKAINDECLYRGSEKKTLFIPIDYIILFYIHLRVESSSSVIINWEYTNGFRIKKVKKSKQTFKQKIIQWKHVQFNNQMKYAEFVNDKWWNKIIYLDFH